MMQLNQIHSFLMTCREVFHSHGCFGDAVYPKFKSNIECGDEIGRSQ